MTLSNFATRAKGLYSQIAYTALFRKPVRMRNRVPVISFTFDDFPRSAYQAGGAILQSYGFRGTYYAALGLMGGHTSVGEIFSSDDLSNVVADGHELGCHTFAHCDAWETAPAAFERSILENQRSLQKLLPVTSFKTLAYPKSGPRPHTKRRAAKHFVCCRSGGQTYNASVADRYLLFGYFIEQSKHDLDGIKRIIDANSKACGWLIFATHDIRETSSRFGCSAGFFDSVVRYASRSGAGVLPVVEAWNLVCEEVLRIRSDRVLAENRESHSSPRS